MPAKSSPNFYALLVGINDYDGHVDSLHGCENDVKAMKAWLQANMPARGMAKPLHIKTLLNEQATKENVSLAFLDHLAQAGEGDIALFYYSGHGAQEVANEYFKAYEADDQLETIVLYDSRAEDKSGKRTGTDLADKELRYLLHQVSKNGPHTVAMFDCCHAGGNIRDIQQKKKNKDGPKKRLSEKVKARSWEDFVFSPAWVERLKQQSSNRAVAQSLPAIAGDQLKKYALDELLPPPAVIQLAACRSEESALEDWTWEDEEEKGGIFTYTLLSVLNQSEGGVSYYDLSHRVRRFVRGQKPQTPQIYASGNGAEWLFEGFLGGEADGKGLYGLIQYEGGRWVMNMGAIHGIPPVSNARTPRVRVEDNTGKVLGSTDIAKVHPEYCELKDAAFLPIPDEEEEKGISYKGFLDNFFSAPVNIALVELDQSGKKLTAPGNGIRLFQKKLKDLAIDNLHIVESIEQAQYMVVARQKEEDYLICLPSDTVFRPIVKEEHGKSSKSLKGFQEKAVETVINKYLNNIGRWEFVKELENTQPKIFKYKPPIAVSFFSLETEFNHDTNKREIKAQKPVPLNDKGEPLLAYESIINEEYAMGFFKIILKNTSTQSLNVAPLMMFIDFSIAGIPGQESIISIPAGKTHEMNVAFNFMDPKHAAAYPSPYVDAYLKLVVATRKIEFDVEKFKMDGLPPPAKKGMRSGPAMAFDAIVPDVQDWTTQLLRMNMKNPYREKQT